MNPEFVDLQVKVTYLESLLASLDEVVTRQAEEIGRLAERIAQVEAQLAGGDRSDPGEEPPPPHY